MVGDFLISVQGMDVFECDHAQVVTAVKNAGNCLNLAVERYFIQLVYHTHSSKILRSVVSHPFTDAEYGFLRNSHNFMSRHAASVLGNQY